MFKWTSRLLTAQSLASVVQGLELEAILDAALVLSPHHSRLRLDGTLTRASLVDEHQIHARERAPAAILSSILVMSRMSPLAMVDVPLMSLLAVVSLAFTA